MKHLLLFTVCFVIGSICTNMEAQNLLLSGDFEDVEKMQTANYSGYLAPTSSGAFVYSSSSRFWKLKKPNTSYVQSDIYTETGKDENAENKALQIVLNAGYPMGALTGNPTNFPWYNNAVYQGVEVDKTKKYEVTLWAKGNHSIMAQFHTQSSSAVAIGGQPTAIITNNWQQYSFTLDVAGRVENGSNDNVSESDYTENTIFALSLTAITTTVQNELLQQWVSEKKYAFIDDVVVKEYVETSLDNPQPFTFATYVDGKTVYFSIDEVSEVSVYNLSGVLVAQQTIAPGDNLTLDNKGCYILRIKNEKGVASQKIII